MSNKTVAFVLYPGLTPLDLIGPLQVMSGLEAVEEALGWPDRHHVVVVAERLDAFPTDTPVRIAASTTIHDIPAPDVVLVPGGGAPTLRQLANPVLLDFCGRPTATPKSWPPSAQVPCCSPEPTSCKVAPPPLTGHIVDSLTGLERGTSQNAGSRIVDI